jgi:hypothetical protein
MPTTNDSTPEIERQLNLPFPSPEKVPFFSSDLVRNSTSGFEVDFIIGDHTAVELKAKENLSPQDLKPLLALAAEKKLKRYLCVSLELRPRKLSGVTALPFQQFLDELWSGEYA